MTAAEVNELRVSGTAIRQTKMAISIANMIKAKGRLILTDRSGFAV
jgi:hypothetical protein